MWTKIIIISFLVLILYNLGAGLYYMMQDKGQSTRTVRALSWRIGLSIFLFIMLIIGKMTGILETNPDPIYGTRTAPTQQNSNG